MNYIYYENLKFDKCRNRNIEIGISKSKYQTELSKSKYQNQNIEIEVSKSKYQNRNIEISKSNYQNRNFTKYRNFSNIFEITRAIDIHIF